MAGIFISYRRSDASAEVTQLAKTLSAAFPESLLFFDIESIFPGSDFTKVLDEHLKKTKVLLVVIGTEWLSAVNLEGSRRLDDPNDFVRLEIVTALQRKIPIIPVLLREATMPARNLLPNGLSQLALCQAVSVGFQFEHIRILEGAIRRHLSWLALDRVTFAVASGAALGAIVLALIAGFIAAAPLGFIANYFWPAVSGVTTNLLGGSLLGIHFSRNEDLFYKLFYAALASPLALLAFGIGTIIETRFKNILRLMVITFFYGIILGFSIVNFIAKDSLTNIYNQVFIDIVLVVSSALVIYIVRAIPCSDVFQRVSRTALVTVVLVLGIAFPALFLLTFVAWKLHVITSYHISSSDYIIWISLVVGLAAAMGTFQETKKK